LNVCSLLAPHSAGRPQNLGQNVFSGGVGSEQAILEVLHPFRRCDVLFLFHAEELEAAAELRSEALGVVASHIEPAAA